MPHRQNKLQENSYIIIYSSSMVPISLLSTRVAAKLGGSLFFLMGIEAKLGRSRSSGAGRSRPSGG
jgi:hypothetical protein